MSTMNKQGLKRNSIIYILLSISGILLSSVRCPKISAEEVNKSLEKTKNSIVSFSLTGVRYTLKADNDNELVGNGMKVSLGGGYIAKSWFINAMLDVSLGPYEPARDGQLNVDYGGTGLTVWWATSAQTLDLRSSEGSYGFALGASYADIVGRSVGRNRKETSNPNDPANSNLVDNYVMRATYFSVLPSIFFAWLKDARLKGNTPSLLSTRLEGYVLTLGVAVPLMARYQTHYDKRQVLDESDGEGTLGSKRYFEEGTLKGYSILLSFTSFLGI